MTKLPSSSTLDFSPMNVGQLLGQERSFSNFGPYGRVETVEDFMGFPTRPSLMVQDRRKALDQVVFVH